MRVFFVFLFLTLSVVAGDLSGKVVGVHDGDSFTLLSGRVQHKIRLHGIDAPELGQAFGKKAKKAFSGKIHGQDVRVSVTGKDQWKRITGTVFLGEENVNLWMVQNGWAHHFDKYSGSKILADAEKSARSRSLGLWKQINVQTPDAYRAAKKKRQAIQKLKESGKADEKAGLQYWMNTKSKVRHNQSCRWFKKTKRGRLCTEGEGKACSKCGG